MLYKVVNYCQYKQLIKLILNKHTHTHSHTHTLTHTHTHTLTHTHTHTLTHTHSHTHSHTHTHTHTHTHSHTHTHTHTHTQEKLAPNVLVMVHSFNQLALLVPTEVLREPTRQQRAKVITAYIQVQLVVHISLLRMHHHVYTWKYMCIAH